MGQQNVAIPPQKIDLEETSAAPDAKRGDSQAYRTGMERHAAQCPSVIAPYMDRQIGSYAGNARL
jgi:hypothetical protein